MIELIFVIVIIGILAAVAIPKLAKNRTDAQATICVHEAGMLINEVASSYTALGFDKFKTEVIQNMTNIRDEAAPTSGHNSVKTGGKVHSTGTDYYCDGLAIMNLKSVVNGKNYELTIKPATSGLTSPAAAQAAAEIKETITDNATTKVIKL
jgi:type II secretory pathway pseudopilin PulG